MVRLSRVLVRPGRESRSTPTSCTGTIRPRVRQNINTPFMLLTCVCLHSSFPGVFHCTVRGGEMGGRPPLPPVGVACGTMDDNIIDGRCQYRNLTTHLIQDQDNWAGPGRLGWTRRCETPRSSGAGASWRSPRVWQPDGPLESPWPPSI